MTAQRAAFEAGDIEAGQEFRTVRELLGHKHVNTTEICTHVLNRGAGGGWGAPP